jgi:hypothetical protein
MLPPGAGQLVLTLAVAAAVGGLLLAWSGGSSARAVRAGSAARRCWCVACRRLRLWLEQQRRSPPCTPEEQAAERRRVAFVATHRAAMDAGTAAGHYTALAIEAPTPDPPAWLAAAGHGRALPTALQLAQRRLAFALSQLSASGADHPLAASVSDDLVQSVGEALALRPVTPPPLRFTLAAEGGYALGAEDGAVVKPIEGLRDGRSLRLALCADEVMRTGRHCAAFTIVRMGPWNGMYIGVAKRHPDSTTTGTSGQDAAPAAGGFWAIESSEHEIKCSSLSLSLSFFCSCVASL